MTGADFFTGMMLGQALSSSSRIGGRGPGGPPPKWIIALMFLSLAGAIGVSAWGIWDVVTYEERAQRERDERRRERLEQTREERLEAEVELVGGRTRAELEQARAAARERLQGARDAKR
jgi:hypothetical protein